MSGLGLGEEAGFIALPVGQAGLHGLPRGVAGVLTRGCCQLSGLDGGLQRRAAGQPVAAFGLAAAVQHQRVAFDQQQGQREQLVDRPALEFEFHLAQRFAVVPGQDFAVVDGDLDDAARGAGDLANLAFKAGAELRL